MTTAHQDWLNERRSYIGGSDSYGALALVDDSGRPYFGKTPLKVYLDKTSDEEIEDEETPELEWGHRHESTIADAYTDRTGLSTQRVNEPRRHRKHPFLAANLDRLVRSGPRERRILEIKTSKRRDWWGSEDEGVDGIPPPYFCQVQHYLNVCDADVADVAVLIQGSELRIYRDITPDQEFIAMLEEAEVKLWTEHIEPRVPPDPAIGETAMRWPIATETAVQCNAFHMATVRDYIERAAAIKAAEKELAATRDIIQAWMGEHRYLTDPDGEVLVDWRTTVPKAKTLDLARIEREDPELLAKLIARYGKERKPFRSFNLKEKA